MHKYAAWVEGYKEQTYTVVELPNVSPRNYEIAATNACFDSNLDSLIVKVKRVDANTTRRFRIREVTEYKFIPMEDE